MQLCGIIKRGFSSAVAIKNVTVVGGGLMGYGIVQAAASAGYKVTLVEINADVLKKAQDRITISLGRVGKKKYKDDEQNVKKFVEDTNSRINGLTDPSEAVKDADLVIEAIVENIEIKHKLFKSLDKVAPEKAIFASNTSSLSIQEIASVTNRKDRFGGLHFFNPAHHMKLLEVIRTPDTSQETYETMIQWGKSIGKTCITCKDTPGFIVNRLLIPYMAEAIRIVEQGDASPRDVDTAIKLGAGYHMGPIEMADYVGHDTVLSVLEGWHKKFPDNPLYNRFEIVEKMVQEGKLGTKTGEGFYKYNK